MFEELISFDVTLIYSSNLAVQILITQPHVLVIFYKVEGEKPPGETW